MPSKPLIKIIKFSISINKNKNKKPLCLVSQEG
jgi:hypothetical protein